MAQCPNCRAAIAWDAPDCPYCCAALATPDGWRPLPQSDAESRLLAQKFPYAAPGPASRLKLPRLALAGALMLTGASLGQIWSGQYWWVPPVLATLWFVGLLWMFPILSEFGASTGLLAGVAASATLFLAMGVLWTLGATHREWDSKTLELGDYLKMMWMFLFWFHFLGKWKLMLAAGISGFLVQRLLFRAPSNSTVNRDARKSGARPSP